MSTLFAQERGKNLPPSRPGSGLRDPQGEEARAVCRRCFGEVYPGEEYYQIDGQTVCLDCFAGWAADYFRLYRTGGAED